MQPKQTQVAQKSEEIAIAPKNIVTQEEMQPKQTQAMEQKQTQAMEQKSEEIQTTQNDVVTQQQQYQTPQNYVVTQQETQQQQYQTPQNDVVTQQEMQQQQYENLGGSPLVSQQQQQNDQVQKTELLPLPIQPTQDNAASQQEPNASEQAVEEPISQVVQQPDLSQNTEDKKQQSQSHGGSEELKKE
jgi:hypothetical protein